MDDPELDDTLEKLHQELHNELEQAGDLDEESRQHLLHLMGDIRAALDRQPALPGERSERGEPSEADQSLGEQITETIVEYEISHPSLVAALRHALDILSGAGI